jgi:hypothetical protein
MKPSRPFHFALPLALAALAGCGGAANESAFQSAAPSYQALSMDLTSSDTNAPSAAALTVEIGGAADAASPDCHPHLFIRTHDVVSRVNRHLWHFLRHVEGVIHRNPDLVSGPSQVWEREKDGIDVRLTITRESDVLFTWTLAMKKVADAAFVTVFSGQIDRTDAQGAHQGVGDATLDLGALAGVTGQEVAGVLTVHFETFTASRLLVVDAKGVVWDSDANAPFLRQPRDAHYVYDREPGKGGSVKIEEQMVFACPLNPDGTPNATQSADVKLVSRWYRTTSGGVHGRSDALMTGGQLPAGDTVVGLTCHASDAEGGDQAESYWLMKEEDATGATVGGAMHSTTSDASACDPALNPPTGDVPALDTNATDFDMSGIVFTDSTPYQFPGM